MDDKNIAVWQNETSPTTRLNATCFIKSIYVNLSFYLWFQIDKKRCHNIFNSNTLYTADAAAAAAPNTTPPRVVRFIPSI